MTPSLSPLPPLPPVAPVVVPATGAFERAMQAEMPAETQRVRAAATPAREAEPAARAESVVQQVDAVRQDQVAVVLHDNRMHQVSQVELE